MSLSDSGCGKLQGFKMIANFSMETLGFGTLTQE
jgi:hypothetical protein